MKRLDILRDLAKNSLRSDNLLRDLTDEHNRLLEFIQSVPAICAQEQEGDTSLTDVIIRYIKSLENNTPLTCDICHVVVTDPWHGSGVLNGKVSKHIHACDDCRDKLPAAGFRYVWLDTMKGFSQSWNSLAPTGPLSLESLKGFLDEHPEKINFKLIEYRCLTNPDFEFVQQMKLR